MKQRGLVGDLSNKIWQIVMTDEFKFGAPNIRGDCDQKFFVYPKLSELRKFCCNSLPNNERLHCTLKRMKIGTKNDYYVLYLEYLGKTKKAFIINQGRFF